MPKELKKTKKKLKRKEQKLLEVSKKGERSQINLNLPENKLEELKQIATKKGAPTSVLARMWIIEKIEEELKS